MMVTAPQSEQELLMRAEQLEGHTLAELAIALKQEAPDLILSAKGWSGQLLEIALGATAGSLAEPDFQQLGIELKTVPIDAEGHPIESTYVSIVPLTQFVGLTWENSDVYKKLKRILWVPLLTAKGLPPGERRIGRAFLWSPTAEQEAILRQDWQELMDKVAMGQLEEITARQGTYLQIRPKGANNRSLCWGINAEGNRVLTLPRGFYLRSAFTRTILRSG